MLRQLTSDRSRTPSSGDTHACFVHLASGSAARAGISRGRGHPGLALVIMLSAQLMIILDLTVVNIALPHIQAGLRFSTDGLSWVLNAYTLTFGGLLLLGGRAGDILGRRRVFLAGIILFTLASLAGGLATEAWWLLAARALQGVGGALASPAVLALVVGSFPEGRERTRALAVYSAVVMGGASLGLVLGGLITEWASWRWVLFVNVPVGILVVAVTPLFVTESPRQPAGRPGRRAHLDRRDDRAGVRVHPGRVQRLGRPDDAGRVRRGRGAAGRVPADRDTDRAADHPAAAVRQPGPVQFLPDPAAAGGGHVRDVLLPDPVRAGDPGLQPARRRGRVPAPELTVFGVSRAAPRLLPRFGPTG